MAEVAPPAPGGLRHGLLTPVVSLNPRAHNAWEVDASVEDLVTVARAADGLGFHHLTCSEHVAVPRGGEARRGTRYWDPVATLSHLAAVTERIRLAAHVVVLPYHHPLELVKRYGTLDRLSGGRVILGVGVGSLAEEFALLDVPFAERGPLADDTLRAIRATWGDRHPAYAGTHHRFGGVVVDPLPVQPTPTVWVGGRSLRSLRRAVALGEGWAPFGLGPDDVADMLATARSWPAWGERAHPLDVVVWPEPAADPLHDPDGTRHEAARWSAAGATRLHHRLRSDSVDHHLAQLEALATVLADT